MSAFSDYLERNILNATLRGQTFISPTRVYLGLFTSDPTDAGSGAELTDAAYVRQDAAGGSDVASGFTQPVAEGEGHAVTNANVLRFPPVADAQVTITHFALFDAASAGNLLYHAAFDKAKTLDVDDVLSVDSGGIKVILE